MDPEIKPRLLCTCACHTDELPFVCNDCDGSSASCTRDARLRHTFDVGAIPELDDEVTS